LPESKASPEAQAAIAEAIELCRQDIRTNDPDRYFASLFAPPETRSALWTLYAFNMEIARVREIVSEPMIGHIRLQWWRETFDIIADGNVREHHVVQALANVLGNNTLAQGGLIDLIDARAADLEGSPPENIEALYEYAEATAGALSELAARICGPVEAETRQAARRIGTAWGLTGLVKAAPYHLDQGKSFLPGITSSTALYRDGGATIHKILDRASSLFAEASRTRFSKKYRPVSVLAPLIQYDIGRLRCLNESQDRLPPDKPFSRQWRMCRAAWFRF